MAAIHPIVPDIKYGGVSKKYLVCGRCGRSIDLHRIPFIRAGGETAELAFTLQGLLSEADMESMLGKQELPVDSSMAGAAHVYFGNGSDRSYVTCSGKMAEALLSRINHTPIKRVSIVNYEGSLHGIDGATFTPTVEPEQLGKKPYPMGSCAAQKLLTQIFIDAQSRGGVTAIEMSEIMWRSPKPDEDGSRRHKRRVAAQSREWRTGVVVHSCELCKQVLPQMLCDQHD